MDRYPNPAGAGRTPDDAGDETGTVEKLTVFVATNGQDARPYLSELEAETYAQSRLSGGKWRVEPWEARLIQRLSDPEPRRLKATR